MTLRLIKQDDEKHSINVKNRQLINELSLIQEEKDNVKNRSSFSQREIRESMYDHMNIIRSHKSTNYRFRDNARILRMYCNADARNFDRNFDKKLVA